MARSIKRKHTNQKKIWFWFLAGFAVLGIHGCPAEDGGSINPPTPTPKVTPPASPSPTSVAGGVTLETLDFSKHKLRTRPRLWGHPDGLQKKAISTNPIWSLFKAENERRTPGCVDRAKVSEIFNFAIGHSANKTDSEWLWCAKNQLLALPGKYVLSKAKEDYGSLDLALIAVSYDHLAPFLVDREKKEIVSWVYEKLIPHVQKHACDHRSPKESWCNPQHNLVHTKWAGEFLWNLASYEDDERSREGAVFNLNYLRNELSFLESDLLGVPYGGSHYGYVRTHKMLAYVHSALFHAVEGYRGWPSYASDSVSYFLSSLLPNMTEFMASYQPGAARFLNGRIVASLLPYVTATKEDLTTQAFQHFLLNEYIPKTYIHRYYLGEWFLWFDPDIGATWPRPQEYSGPSIQMAHSDHRKDSLFVSLFAQKWVGDHQVPNCGSVRMWRGKHHVIENGWRYSAGSPQFTSTSMLDANIIYIGGAVGGLETGGMPRRGLGYRCRTLESTSSGSLSILRGDLTGAYDDSWKVSKVRRTVVLHRPSTVFVLDHIVTEDPARKQLFFHLSENPSLSGSEASYPGLTVRSLTNHKIIKELVEDKTTASDISQNGTDEPVRLVVQGGMDRKVAFVTAFYFSDERPSVELVSPGKARISGKEIKYD